jgi:hypothetical protein
MTGEGRRHAKSILDVETHVHLTKASAEAKAGW